jgi:hypothetical protein
LAGPLLLASSLVALSPAISKLGRDMAKMMMMMMRGYL